jgi:Flp pilus assembly CpaF family ATPase
MTGFELILPFLRPIQALILDPEISEIMINGTERIFVEKQGYVEAVEHVTMSQKSLGCSQKHCPALRRRHL